MTFEWDSGKADANRRKLSRPDPFPTEERSATLGRDLLDRLIVVVWTWRGEAIRLISARRATPRERRRYAEDVDA